MKLDFNILNVITKYKIDISKHNVENIKSFNINENIIYICKNYRWFSVDKNGDLYIYIDEPSLNENIGKFTAPTVNNFIKVFKVAYTGDWKLSLTRINLTH